MATIEIDFDVFKALTNLRKAESDTYNHVLRRLLNLGVKETVGRMGAKGATFKGVFFPEGTHFRGTYKGRTYMAEIHEGRWIDSLTREARTSPSDAAVSITGKNWNGWNFWDYQYPGDSGWRSISALR